MMGGILLTAAAALSVHDAVTNEEVAPLSWMWLLGFDALVPVWAMFLVRAWRERDQAEQVLERLATTDALTGVLNRNGFLDQATAALSRARRAGQGSSVVMFDLDEFKAINDAHGHAAGDAVLRHFACVLRDGLRAGDVLGRIGGEEFALLLPGSDAAQAETATERLRAQAREQVSHPSGVALVTVSAGVAAIQGDDTAFASEAGAALAAGLKAADAALYQAKVAGRDRVVVSATTPAISHSDRHDVPSDGDPESPAVTTPRTPSAGAPAT